MYCQNCGSALGEGTKFCPACGKPAGAAPGAATRPVVAAGYGGFWLRFVAWLIDAVMCFIGLILAAFSVGIVIGIVYSAQSVSPYEAQQKAEAIGRSLAFPLLTGVSWLYYALLESSSWQATLGKRALGLAVTDLDGNPISFWRATGRHFAKIISGIIIWIGFIMAGFTEKKQALHDLMAGCLVVKRG